MLFGKVTVKFESGYLHALFEYLHICSGLRTGLSIAW